MRIIDGHTHISPGRAALAVRVMDAVGIESAVVAQWPDGHLDRAIEDIARYKEFPGRFILFGNFDLAGIDQPGFADRTVAELRRAADAGMRGVKVYKALGLGARDASGELLRVDDERLDPIWAAAGELGLPVLFHTADPRAFWEPMDEHNPWHAVLLNQPDWSYYRRGLPGRDELLGERNRVILRHPGTNFIGPHLGSWEDDFETLAEMLEAMGNLFVDISARVTSFGPTDRRARAAQKLFADFPDRIIFGT
ncbi:hypothetical protein LCGC14_3060560, partial [marine sediment metagenome]